MMKKSAYIFPQGDIDRFKFRTDLFRVAQDERISIPAVLRKFFAGEEFTKSEMGKFALNTSDDGSFVAGVIALLHALGATADSVRELRILDDYIVVMSTDVTLQAATWKIDIAMNWPIGTLSPVSVGMLRPWMVSQVS